MACEDGVSKEVCNAKRVDFEDRFRRDEKQLDMQSNTLNEIRLVLAELKQIAKTQSEALSDQGRRITNLEHRPGNMWDKAISAIIAAVVGGVAAAFVALVIK